MSSFESFGFESIGKEYVKLLTVQTDYQPTCFEEYQILFNELVKLAKTNPGYIPIMTFNQTPEDRDDKA